MNFVKPILTSYVRFRKRHLSILYRCVHLDNAIPWETVIGLEIHAQIAANSKLFSRSGTAFIGRVNNQVSFLDSALPGTLPVINKRCVEAGVLTALALKCKLNYVSKFDRKHYFYADLPAGYQITQQRLPLGGKGVVDYVVRTRTNERTMYESHRTHITQLQLEQDSGKSLHDDEQNISLIDLNRAGIALMEIITEPDFRSAEQASAFVRELQRILTTIGTCDGKMQEGSLRVDASVSIRKPGEPLGVRTEVKNLNSIRFVEHAIKYEIQRQIQIKESGNEVSNETRSFDFSSGETKTMRDKEKLHDYRFMPEPNLPPLRIYNNTMLTKGLDPSQVVNVDTLRNQMPELPAEQRERFIKEYKVHFGFAWNVMRKPGRAKYFDEIMKEDPNRNVKTVIYILLGDLLDVLKDNKCSFTNCPINTFKVSEVIRLLDEETIGLGSAKKIFQSLYKNSSQNILELIDSDNLQQLTDMEVIEQLCKDVLSENPKKNSNIKLTSRFLLPDINQSVMVKNLDATHLGFSPFQTGLYQVKDFHKHKDKMLKYFVRRVLKKSNDRAHVKKTEHTLKQMLNY